MAKKEYLSLKEASAISGYSPDYLGQLLRSGKLAGKQVFQQVTWVTTEEDLRRYMDARQRAEEGQRARKLRLALMWRMDIPRLATALLYLLAALSLCLFLLLFYILSSSLEQRFDQRALRAAQAQQL